MGLDLRKPHSKLLEIQKEVNCSAIIFNLLSNNFFPLLYAYTISGIHSKVQNLIGLHSNFV